MKSLKFVVAILALIGVSIYVFNVQAKENKYTLKGEVDNYNGMIYINPAAPLTYYNGFTSDSAEVKDGKFEIELDLNKGYALPFFFTMDKTLGYRTDWVLLEPTDQHITIDSLYQYVVPDVANQNPEFLRDQKHLAKFQDSLVRIFKDSWQTLNSMEIEEVDFLKEVDAARERLVEQSDEVLVHFTEECTESDIAFWNIAIKLFQGGFSNKLEMAFDNLSPEVKQSNRGLKFRTALEFAKRLRVGSYFPVLELQSLSLEKTELNLKENTNSKYTLIDFWFSHCGPCLVQFPKLKEIYGNHHPGNLEIIGISTDVSSKIMDWQQAVQKHNLPWSNQLDENGILASAMGVNKFPTNFLLDENGKILEKDILVQDLETLLQDESK